MPITVVHRLHFKWHSVLLAGQFGWWTLAAVFQRLEEEQAPNSHKLQGELRAQVPQAPRKIPAAFRKGLI